MGRSKRRAGMIEQRSRAKTRGAHDRRRTEKGHSRGEGESPLFRFIEDLVKRCDDLDALERLDLAAFLRQSEPLGRAEEPPWGAGERLRCLAIAVEDEVCNEQPRGWTILERIYREAERLARHDELEWVLHSTALSAHRCARAVSDGDAPQEPNAALKRRLVSVAFSSAERLVARFPRSGAAHERLGIVTYFEPRSDPERALACFEEALRLGHTEQWALWYRTCCLFDLARWDECLASFDSISAAWFSGRQRAWRYECYLENRATCALRAGHRERALREFEALLCRYERCPELAEHSLLVGLEAAAKGELAAELGERSKQLLERQGLL